MRLPAEWTGLQGKIAETFNMAVVVLSDASLDRLLRKLDPTLRPSPPLNQIAERKRVLSRAPCPQ